MRPVEAQWDAMLNYYDHFTILVFGTFLLHEFVYFTRWIPFWICDQIPAMRKYKIQQVCEGASAAVALRRRALIAPPARVRTSACVPRTSPRPAR